MSFLSRDFVLSLVSSSSSVAPFPTPLPFLHRVLSCANSLPLHSIPASSSGFRSAGTWWTANLPPPLLIPLPTASHTLHRNPRCSVSPLDRDCRVTTRPNILRQIMRETATGIHSARAGESPPPSSPRRARELLFPEANAPPGKLTRHKIFSDFSWEIVADTFDGVFCAESRRPLKKLLTTSWCP